MNNIYLSRCESVTTVLRIKKRAGKYEYVIEKDQAWVVRLIGFLGIISTALLAWGYYQFIRVDLLLAATSIPFLIVVVYFGVNYLLQALYPGFDSKRHASKVHDYWEWHKVHMPRVVVFIPAAGEDPKIVGRTACAARDMHYVDKQVYILDDTPKGIYKDIADNYGAGWVHRPNSGVGKKSGNLNYALAHTPTSDHVLVLDADFVPRAEMLHEMMPYTAEGIGIIQTPQHFVTSKEIYHRSKVEYGAGYVQREFYRITQVARNHFGSAICVGTNALYNRRALEDIGGYAEVDHSEDVNTGLKMLNFVRSNGFPYKIRYIPVQLATGECPSTYYSFYKQQNRWSTGSFRLIFSKRTMFSPVLRPVQKLIYFSNCLYYLYTICILFMPLQLLMLSLVKHNDYRWGYAYCFIPQMIMRLVIVPYIFYQERKRLATIVVTMGTAYTFLQALWLLIIRRPLGWEATGAGSAAPKHNRFMELKIFVGIYYICIYIGTLSIAILNEALGRQTSYLLQMLFLVALISQTIHLAYLYLYGLNEDSRAIPVAAKRALAAVGMAAVSIVTGVSFLHSTYNFYAAGKGQIGLVRQNNNVSLKNDHRLKLAWNLARIMAVRD